MTTTITMPVSKPATGRRWAYTGIILGGAVSIAANVAHSFIPPHGAPAGWHPQPGAVVGAIVWPVFLFIAIEIMARTTWPTAGMWKALRWGGLLPVAVVAAFVSYRHLSGLLSFYGEEHVVTILGPIAVDGLMAMATGALLATTHTTGTVPVTPLAAPAPVTEPAPSTVDTTPPPTRPATKTPATKRAPAKKTTPAAKRAPATKTTPALASPLAPVAMVEPAPIPDQPAVPAHLVPTARFAVTNHHATTGRTITAPELAARMSVSTDLAGRLLTLLDLPVAEPTPAITAGTNGTHPDLGVTR